MIFYQGLLESKIWSEKHQKIVVDFSPDGVFETDDEEIIETLNEMGYPTEFDRQEWERTGRFPRKGGFQNVGKVDKLPSGRPSVEDYKPGQQTPVRAPDAPPMPATETADLHTATADKVVKRKKIPAMPKKATPKKKASATKKKAAPPKQAEVKPRKKIARRSKTSKK